jgi:toxin ParE1/3/4
MIILWLSSAERDLESLTDFIAENSPQTAIQIFNTVRQSVEKLRTYPLIGREGRVERTRELVVLNLPYIVVYMVTEEIRILAVLHASRKWPNEFSS